MLDAEGHELVEVQPRGGIEDDHGVQSEDRQHGDECAHGRGCGQLAGRGVLARKFLDGLDGMAQKREDLRFWSWMVGHPSVRPWDEASEHEAGVCGREAKIVAPQVEM